MDSADILKREAKVLTFDLFGTLVDLQSRLQEQSMPFLRHWTGNSDDLAEALK